jgi:deoxycytidylate deaminase
MMTANDGDGRQQMTTTKTNDKDKQHQQQTLTSNHATNNAIINLAKKNDKGDK